MSEFSRVFVVDLGIPGADGFVAGLAHYLSLLYWLLLIPYRWHGLPLGPALGWIALSSFTALYPATWVWLVTVQLRSSIDSVPADAARRARLSSVIQALPLTWTARAAWCFCAAAAWVALEMIRARCLSGFPWSPLGASQYRMLPLIQISSVTGVYGLSFIAVWVSAALLSAGVMLIRRPGSRSVWVAEVCIPILIAATLFNVGFRVLRGAAAKTTNREISIMLVQPSIPQTLIWDPSQDTNRFSELVQYTREVLTNHSDIVIWPESAVPKMLRYDTNTFNAISKLAQDRKVWVIVGSDDAEPSRERSGERDAADFFNSSFLINPQGDLVARYIKRNLVIFGEYVPLQHWLPFLKWFTPVEAGFTPGTGPVEFFLNSLDVRTSVLICFEDIFPHLAPADIKPDTDFLVNITNDGWFGESAAQWQQATAALFRAIENRLPLIRCCNNGVTCWIDEQGRIRDVLRDAKGTVYGEGYLRADIPILPRGDARRLTFYTQHGDVFGWACVALGAMMAAAPVVRAVKSRAMRSSKHPKPEI